MDFVNIFKKYENALDAASLRQQVISNNIANASSPNFSGQTVAFEEELMKAMDARKSDKELGGVFAVSLEDGDDPDMAIGGGSEPGSVRAKVMDTGQKVDLNNEMAGLAKNQIHYNMLSDGLGGFFKAINGVVDSLGR